MSNNAKVVILGNLTADPQMSSYNNTSVVSFQVAVSTAKKEQGPDGKDKWLADFYNVSVWGRTGEFILPRLQKGTQVQVVGDLTLSKYKDKKTGEDRQSLTIRATDVLPLARQKGAPERTEEPSNDPF